MIRYIFMFVLAMGGIFAASPVPASAHEGLFMPIAFFGAVINQAVLESIYKGFNVIFDKVFDATTTSLEKLALVVPSKTKSEEYKWLGQFPGMREWLGERVVKDLAAHGFVIKNRDFENTVSVDRNDIEDDTIGVYKPVMEGLASSAKQHPDELLFELMVGGFSQTCFDGQFFFDTDHSNGDQGTWSNKGTAVLSQAAYVTARAAIQSYVNDEGRPLKILPNVLMVPPQLEGMAREILKSERLAAGETNVWKDSAEIMVVPELAANPTYWFLAALNRPEKPFIFQKRRAPEFVALTAKENENVFMQKHYVYGVDYRGNAGYGFPHLMYGSTGGA